MTPILMEPKDRPMVLAHYYRAMVTRADVWRVRMDTTTNWAIGTTAAVLSFGMSNPEVPHYVIFIAVLLSAGFLQLEARRLTFYHLWQHRVLLLEKGFISRALREGSDDESWRLELLDLLGTTVPTMPRFKAAARRLRRVYLGLFTVQALAWLSKLLRHPSDAYTEWDIVERARIAFIPGAIVLAVVVGFLAGALVLAVVMGGVSQRGEEGLGETL